MTRHLLENPHELIPLTFFSERYKAAKSSISEDLAIVKETFEEKGTGKLVTVSGAAGGVKFIPKTAEAEVREVISLLMEELGRSDRLLPGGYLFMTDLLGNPRIMDRVGKVFASAFADMEIDVSHDGCHKRDSDCSCDCAASECPCRRCPSG